MYIQYVYLNFCRTSVLSTVDGNTQSSYVIVNLILGQNFLNYFIHYVFFHQYYDCFNLKVKYSGV
jgi:hypothetical protein